jgi:hypothetical protein
VAVAVVPSLLAASQEIFHLECDVRNRERTIMVTVISL